MNSVLTQTQIAWGCGGCDCRINCSTGFFSFLSLPAWRGAAGGFCKSLFSLPSSAAKRR